MVGRDSGKLVEVRVAVFECETFIVCLLEAEKIDDIFGF